MKSPDIPQGDSLDRVRDVVAAVRDGAHDVKLLHVVTGLSLRHAGYYLNTARTLQLVEGKGESLAPSALGVRLLATTPGSKAEQRLLERAIRQSPVVARLAPTLLDERPPSLAQLAGRIRASARLADATARRRAHTLLGWRRRLKQSQLSIPAAAG